MSSLSMRELLEAGAHFGHQTRFWSPKMSQYIFGSRNKIHIINLEKTVAKFDEAAKFLTNLAAQKGTILFVGTKRTSRDAIVAEAKRAGMPYVDQRWLGDIVQAAKDVVAEKAASVNMPYVIERWPGGMLTNFKTVKVSLKRLKEMEQKVADGALEKMTKKEALDFTRELEKLNKAMGGIKEMNGLPDALVVVDVGYHKIAIQEANKLGIPVVGIVDTNHNPAGVDYVIPGNDDSARAVALYAKGFADAILEGKNKNLEDTVKAAKDSDFVEEAAVEEKAE